MAEGLNMTVQEVVDKLLAEWAQLETQFPLSFELVGRAVDHNRDNRECYQVEDTLARIDCLRQRQDIIAKFVAQLKQEALKSPSLGLGDNECQVVKSTASLT